MSMSDEWSLERDKTPDPHLIEATFEVLKRRFDASDAVLRQHARSLCSTVVNEDLIIVRRAHDKDKLEEFAFYLRSAIEAFNALSPRTRNMVQLNVSLSDLRVTFEKFANSAEIVADNLPNTPFSGRENVRAILTVQNAGEIWDMHRPDKFPKAGLNPTSPFANFLAELFKSLRVGSDPRSAFSAWVKCRDRGHL